MPVGNSKSQMRILQLISSSGFFGAENVVLQLSAELQKEKGYYPIVGAIANVMNLHMELVEECRKKGIETLIFPCNGKIDIKTIWQLRKFICANNIKIIHSHGYKSNLYSFFSSRGISTRLVATCHNWLGDDMKMKGYAMLDRFMLRRFDKVVSVSHDVAKKAIESGISHKKVHIVENGIAMDRFTSHEPQKNIRKDFGIPEARIIIGTVGRLSEEKGHRVLFNAAAQILNKYPQAVFLIVGDGPLRKDLEKEFSSSSIIFTGFRRDLPEIYRHMDIFVLPSLTEGLPMVILEAMASKIPIIATRVGAIPTIINDKQTGLLVNPGDEVELKAALLSALENRDSIKKMAEKAYYTVRDNYSSRTMAIEYMNLYSQIVDDCK